MKKGKLAALTALCLGAGLLIAAISMGQVGPSAQRSAYALDSSGTGPPPIPVADITGPSDTRNLKPLFWLGPTDPGITFMCRMGLRPWGPCVSPFRAPDLGLGRHVLVVMAVDEAGNYSYPLKHPFVVSAPRASIHLR